MEIDRTVFKEVCDEKVIGEGYSAPNLFPDIVNHVDYFAKRDYIERVILDLVASGNLFLTDLFNQETPQVTDICGDIILGNVYIENNQERADTNYVINRYKVRIRSLNGKPLRYKVGMQPRGKFIGPVTATNRNRRVMSVDRVIDATEIEIELPHAWHILKQNGRYCRKINRTSLQNKLWTCEEVRKEKKASKK